MNETKRHRNRKVSIAEIARAVSRAVLIIKGLIWLFGLIWAHLGDHG